MVANGDLDRPLAIVRVDDAHLQMWASENNVSYESLNDLADKKETRQAVINSLVEAGKSAGLTKLELGIKDCCLITDVHWLPGSGLTASGKLDRAMIFKMHADELDAMLKRNT